MAGLPGQRTGYTAAPRNIWFTNHGQKFLPGPQIMDATYAVDGKNTSQTDEIRAGMMLAQITATSLWVPCRRTTISGGGSGSGSGAGSLVIPVVDARAFIVGEAINIATTPLGSSPTVTRTITAIDFTNNLITVDGAAMQYNTGGIVTADTGGALAGAEIPRGILAETVRMLTAEPFNTTTYDKPIVVAAGGFVDVNYLLGDYAACRAATTNYLDDFLWSDEQS